MPRREWDLECKGFVGNLHEDVTTSEIEDEFCRCGKIRNVWVAKDPPGFAFIEYETPEDAHNTVRKMDGR